MHDQKAAGDILDNTNDYHDYAGAHHPIFHK